MKLRKFISVFLSAVLLLSAFALPSAALTVDEDYAPDPKRDMASELVVYKDSSKTEKYASVDDIPKGATVYYEIVSEPGYICYRIEIDVYEITDTYFVNDYHGVQLDYTLHSTLAGDTDLSTTYSLKDATNILKFIADCTPEYWQFGTTAYGKCLLDYNCDGTVNLTDVSCIMKDIAGWDMDRAKPCPRSFSLKHLLPVDSEAFANIDVDYICDNGYVVEYGDYAMMYYDIPAESAAKYDSEFFEKYDLVIFNGYCAGGAEPVIEKLWYDTDTRFVKAEFECSNIKFGEGWAVFVPVAKELEVSPNYPR